MNRNGKGDAPRGSGGPGSRRTSMEATPSSGGVTPPEFDPIPEDKHTAPTLSFRSVNPVGSMKFGEQVSMEDLVYTPQTKKPPPPQRPVRLVSMSMQMPRSGETQLLGSVDNEDEDDDESTGESWQNAPAVLKLNQELQMLNLLADAVESKMPNNAKHMRESVGKLKEGVGLLGAQHTQLQRAAERDSLAVNRHMAWANIRNNRFAALQRVSMAPQSLVGHGHEPGKPKKMDKKKRRLANRIEYGVMGVLAIITLVILTMLKPRLPHEEKLQHAHAVSSGHPVVLPLKSSPLNLIETALTVPGWDAGGHGDDHGGGHESHSESEVHSESEAHSESEVSFSKTETPVKKKAAQPPSENDEPHKDHEESHSVSEDSHSKKSDTHSESEESHSEGEGAHSESEGAHTESESHSESEAHGDKHHDGEHDDMPTVKVTVMQYIGSAVLNSHHRMMLSSTPLSEQADFTYNPKDWVAVTGSDDCKLEKKARMCHSSFRKFNKEYDSSEEGGILAVVVSVEPSGKHVPIDLHMHQFGWLGDAKLWFSLITLMVVLGLIALEVIHRTLVAMSGSFVMLSLLLWLDMTPDLGTVLEWVDEGALSLLFGMMILVGKLSSTGFFEVATVKVISLCKGNMWTLVIIMCLLTAVLSAFLDNVTTVLLIAPVSIQMASALHISPIPLLICEVLFSNIGGTATMIGDPPNIIIGNGLEDYIGFVDFIVTLAPGVLIMAVPCLYLLRFMYKGELTGRLEKYDEVLQLGKSFRIKNKKLLIQTGIVLGAVIMAFLLHPLHHVNVAWVAILGAVILMLISSPRHIHKDLEAVEWDTLLFFAALFVMVEAMGEVGLIRKIGDILISIIEAVPESSRKNVSLALIMWVSALVSAFLDNIPYTATMVPVVKQLARAGLGLQLEPLAWALAFGACLGGNGSLVGASANIVVAGIAEREGYHISFVSFLSKSFPVMILSVAIATGYLLLINI